MFKKQQLLILLILMSSLAGYSQTQVTPQWKSASGGLLQYFYPGKSPLGFDTLWNAQTIRSYIPNAFTASNGLTKIGNDFQMGGMLTGTVDIDLNGSAFQLRTSDYGALYQLAPFGLQFRVGYPGPAYPSFTMFSNETSWNYTNDDGGSAIIQSATGIIIQDHTTYKGMQYVDNYGANFTDRSLVDKRYVDSVATGGVDSTTIANTYATKAHIDSVQSGATQNQILLYDQSYFTTLNDFVKYGSFTPSISTDKGILMTGGVSGTDTTNYIRLKGFTNNDDLLNVEVTFVVNDLTGYGIGIGRKTISNSSDYSAFANYDLVNNNVVSRGFIATRTNPSNIVVATNDLCKLIFRIRGNLLITEFYDITQNKYATVSGVNNILNSGDIAIYEHGGSVTIKGIKAYSSSPRNPNLAFLSDSKLRNPVNGVAIGNWDNDFGVTATFAGQGDRLTHLLRVLPYVLKYIKPKQVIVNITRNDLTVGATMPDSVKTQYALLIHKLDSAGIKSAYFKAIPETVIPDQSALNHLVDSLASSRAIDVSPYWSNGTDLGLDGIHPNIDGARLLAWVTKRSGYFDTTSVYSQPKELTENNYARYNQNNNFNTNQVVNGVVIGTRTTFPSDANSHIYTTGVNAPAGYPFANSNQLVLESSANTNKAIVFRTNGANRAYIDASGNMTVGKTDGTQAVSGARLSVTGNFGATGTVTLPSLNLGGAILYTTNTGLVSQFADATTGNVLKSAGAGNVPVYGKVTSTEIDATVAPTASPTFTGNANFTNINSGKIGSNVTFNSATGTTTDSLGFWSSQKKVAKLITAGTGMTITQSATGVTFATTALVNPMTTLGDVIYGGASGVPTRLAGNTTTTLKFLSSLGNGTISAAPSYYDLFGSGNTWSNGNTYQVQTIFQGGIRSETFGIRFVNSGSTSFTADLNTTVNTANRSQTLQDKNGTIALLTDVNSPIAGTPTIVAGAGAGTTPTVSVTSNGKGIQVTVTTGTLPTGANATVATVTLANALPYTPYPVYSSANAATSLLNGASMIYMTSSGTTNVTITSGTTALVAATTYVWNIAL